MRAETLILARVPPRASFTTRYTPPRTNIEQLSTYTARTVKENSMTATMNQGADLPTACSAMPPAQKAEEPRSLSTMAAARQDERKASMTEVATPMRTRSETEAPGCKDGGIDEERNKRRRRLSS